MSAEGVPVVRVVCDLCDGTGTITVVEDYDGEGKSVYAPVECPECDGRLYVERRPYVDPALPASTADAREAQIRAEVIEECAKVCEAMADDVSREDIPYHKRQERVGAIVREMQSRRAAQAIRTLAAKSGGGK